MNAAWINFRRGRSEEKKRTEPAPDVNEHPCRYSCPSSTWSRATVRRGRRWLSPLGGGGAYPSCDYATASCSDWPHSSLRRPRIPRRFSDPALRPIRSRDGTGCPSRTNLPSCFRLLRPLHLGSGLSRQSLHTFVDRHVMKAVDADFALAKDPLHDRAHCHHQGVAMVRIGGVQVRQRLGQVFGDVEEEVAALRCPCKSRYSSSRCQRPAWRRSAMISASAGDRTLRGGGPRGGPRDEP